MPAVAIRTQGGGTAGQVTLSERIFGAKRNLPLMHQAVRAEMENSRVDTRNTLTRGQVTGGGRKPYRQKGTGRARQGSITAPHYRHGGIVFGPHPRDLHHDMPKKMRRAAIFSALSSKLADGELVVVDRLPLDGAISTKTAAAFLSEVVRGTSHKKALLIVEGADDVVIKSVRNIANVTLRVAPSFSVKDVVDGGLVILTRGAIDKIEAVWNPTEDAGTDTVIALQTPALTDGTADATAPVEDANA
jgi:large subunit ribosomal protein L4